ncbi:MAG: hypothetical protein J2P31_16875, partial [Blastocatellia bacterium]|nr:hypothetical protein [Blastocatellia bacterium]
SLASHLGGVVVGLLAISRVRAQKWSWLAALGAFVLLQIFCRLFTPAEFNINTAHRVYDIWKDTIGSYRLYWILSISVIAVTLWAIDSVLLILFPQGKPWTAHYWDKENAELTKYDKTNAQRHDR